MDDIASEDDREAVVVDPTGAFDIDYLLPGSVSAWYRSVGTFLISGFRGQTST